MKAKMYKVKIEIDCFSAKDALILIKSLNSINVISNLKKTLGSAEMLITTNVIYPFSEPKKEIINGVECLVFQSKMNN